MTRMQQRVERDLRDIADHATPSTDAWESIRARIDDAGESPDTEVIMLSPDKPESSRARTWAWIGVAAAVVIAVVIGIAFVLDGDENSSETFSPPPLFDAAAAGTVVDDYFAAFNARDLDGFLAVFAEGGTWGAQFYDRKPIEEYAPFMAWDMATGRTLSPECEVTEEDVDVSVIFRCEVESANAVARAAGVTTPVTTTIILTPDGITRVTDVVEEPDYADIGEPFDVWLEELHPELAADAGCCEADTVEESIRRGELRAGLAEEYGDYVAGNG